MSPSYTQKSLYHRPLVAGVNLALWPIRAWGLAQDEKDSGNMPTDYLCTLHIMLAMLLGFISVTVGIPTLILGLLSTLTLMGVAMALYLALGLSLRYWVGRRCRTLFPHYDYVKTNLDLLQ